jgi:hypothetical protein
MKTRAFKRFISSRCVGCLTPKQLIITVELYLIIGMSKAIYVKVPREKNLLLVHSIGLSWCYSTNYIPHDDDTAITNSSTLAIIK